METRKFSHIRQVSERRRKELQTQRRRERGEKKDAGLKAAAAFVESCGQEMEIKWNGK
ncbi:MAG TPA: hypothetical protein VHF01_16950 [Candidatus Acidoferrum sp.]|nr:hypothetical protein [Candidatus Acidoferrum sp.]